MRFLKSKKGLALLATLVVAAAGAIAGFAYFTSTGNGAGSVTVGAASTWSIGEAGTASGGPLYPDKTIGEATGNYETIPYTVVNNGKGSQNLNQVLIYVANSTGGTWTATDANADPVCNAADFSIDGKAVGATETDGALTGDFTAGQTSTGSVTVQMIDNGSTQNACENQSVPLYFSAS